MAFRRRRGIVGGSGGGAGVEPSGVGGAGWSSRPGGSAGGGGNGGDRRKLGLRSMMLEMLELFESGRCRGASGGCRSAEARGAACGAGHLVGAASCLASPPFLAPGVSPTVSVVDINPLSFEA